MTNARRNRFKFRAADANFGRQSGRPYTKVSNDSSWRYRVRPNVQWRLGDLTVDWQSLTATRWSPSPRDTPLPRR